MKPISGLDSLADSAMPSINLSNHPESQAVPIHCHLEALNSILSSL
jgi:hypothetical protein